MPYYFLIILLLIVLAFACLCHQPRRRDKPPAKTDANRTRTDGCSDSGTSKGNITQDKRSAQDGALSSHNVEKWPQDNADVQFRTNGLGGEPILSLVAFDGGRRIATLRRGENKLQVWSMELVEDTGLPPIEHGSGVIISAIAASKDGRYIVSGDDHGNVIIWNTTTHPSWKVHEFVASRASIKALDVSSDSWRVASGSQDGTVAVWSIKTGELLVGPLKDQDSPVSSVKFSPAGGRIASAYHLAGGDTCSVRIWHSHTGAQLESVPINQSTRSLAWSIDGRQLFIGGSYRLIKRFDIASRSFLPGFRIVSGNLITALHLTWNGQFLFSVSSGHAGGIDIWDVRNMPSSGPFRSCREAHIEGISADDTSLISVGKDTGISVRSLSIIMDKEHPFYHVYPMTRNLKPLTYISNVTHEAWKSGRLEDAEKALSKEIGDSNYHDYGHANLALVRVRQKDRAGVRDDVTAIVSGDGQIPLITSIANALALQKRGDVDAATCAFGSILSSCDHEVQCFIKCVQRIAFLDIGRPDPTRCDTNIPSESSNLLPLVKARKHFHLAKGRMAEQDYETVLSLLQTIPDLRPLLHAPEVTTISLIFGWNLHTLITDIHELRCQALFKSRRTPGAFGYFSERGESLDEELGVITAELSSISEMFGNEARCDQSHDKAIAWYTEALTLAGCPSDVVNTSVASSQAEGDTLLNRGNANPTKHQAKLSRCPQCIAHLLSKRSEVEASTGSWPSALVDANQAIDMDSSYYLGYHSKYAALLGAEYYKEALIPLREMFSKRFSDPDIENLYNNYSETRTTIDQIIAGIFDASPFVLIHVNDGLLCDQKEQRRRFEDEKSFYRLVTSVSTKPNPKNIKKIVKSYFFYVMFSHTWGAKEPSFDDVSGKRIYDLPKEKLRIFCETVRDDGRYRWAWSDTCCINKTDRALYEQSIRSMYKWYRNSALTLVLLAPDSSNIEHNRWMFRAWTLQELLAPEVIRFYLHTWELYQNDTSHNHKISPKIQRELARAIDVKKDTLIHFHPEALPVRQRLRLASTRKATMEVDIAYSLIGVFSSDIRVEYPCEPYVALGRLLQECVSRQGEVTVFDWVGESSKFNSCVPAKISVYSQTPYTLPTISDIDERTKALRNSWHALPAQEELRNFYEKVATQHPPRFFDRRLLLPCITFSITNISETPSVQVQLTPSVQGVATYNVSTTALGEFKFQTEESFANLRQGRRRVLAFPWIPDLLAKIRQHEGEVDPLWLIAYLEQGFKALLFTEQSYWQYRRMAADREIIVPACQLKSLKGIEVEILEVWERL